MLKNFYTAIQTVILDRKVALATAPDRGSIQLFTLLAFAALAIFILPENAFASFDDTRTEWIQSAQTGMTVVMLVISKLLWLALVIIGPLLDNSILFSSCVNTDCSMTMEDSLLSVWVQIRNIVNIIFVVILVFTALYNVIGRTEGEFVLKTMLPKIIIGLIAVNFSFLIGKVVLDAANVATTAVAALPVNSIKLNEVLQDPEFTDFKDDMANNMCKYYKEEADGTYEAVNLDSDQIRQWGLNGICTEDGAFKDEFNKGFLQGFKHTNLAFIMTAQIAKLSRFKFVTLDLANTQATGSASEQFDQILNLILDVLVNFIIMALYGVAVLALLAVAVVRIVVLWLMLALSPLVILFIIIPQLGQGLGDLDLKSAFVQHAIAPVIMMGSLSIGFILLASMTNLSAANTEYNFTIKDDALGKAINGVIQENFDDMHLGDLLALIGGVMVIWTGVFAAANKTYANFITEKLSSFTKQGAGFLAKLPLYATPIPVTPAPGEQGKGALSLGHGMQYIKNMWGAWDDSLTGRTAAEKAWEDAGLKIPGNEKDRAMRDFRGQATNLDSVKKNLGTLTADVELNEGDWKDVAKHIRDVAANPSNQTDKDALEKIAKTIEAGSGDFGKIQAALKKHGITIDKQTAKPAQTTPQPPKTAAELVKTGQSGDLDPDTITVQNLKTLAEEAEGLGTKKKKVLPEIEKQAGILKVTADDPFYAAAIEVAKSGNQDGEKAKEYLKTNPSATTAFDAVITAAGGTAPQPPPPPPPPQQGGGNNPPNNPNGNPPGNPGGQPSNSSGGKTGP